MRRMVRVARGKLAPGGMVVERRLWAWWAARTAGALLVLFALYGWYADRDGAEPAPPQPPVRSEQGQISEPMRAPSQPDAEQASASVYTITVVEGRVVVYDESGSGEPFLTTAITADALLPGDLARLQAGVVVVGRDAVWQYLEGIEARQSR